MRSRLLLAIGAAMLLAPTTAHAVAVSFSVADFDDVSQIVNSGNLLFAANAGAPAGSDVTLNGVTFAGGVQVYDDENVFTDTAAYDSNAHSIAGLTDAQANLLLDPFAFGNAVNNVEITLSGLTIGREYLLQFISVDDRPAAEGRLLDVGSGSDFADGVALDNLDYTRDMPLLISGQFLADATSQVISVGIEGTLGRGHVNAFQLREAPLVVVPEPSTLVLIGLGALVCAFGASRKRRRG